ncbi:hypothetical protein L6452_24273 [Arctium lappa]|uniref:Uncharacterized protein n=1 Tax=Arctium lappa TaxID=4217 RepID=A0ACB9A925_ARCLA|nr:hypothetical protein L6452_24273 [Arctium lappa]
MVKRRTTSPAPRHAGAFEVILASDIVTLSSLKQYVGLVTSLPTIMPDEWPIVFIKQGDMSQKDPKRVLLRVTRPS